jgi:hypothetical protein
MDTGKRAKIFCTIYTLGFVGVGTLKLNGFISHHVLRRKTMSRLSRPNLKGRESIFAGGTEQYRGDIQAICPPNLEECVAAMEDCCEEVIYVATWFHYTD